MKAVVTGHTRGLGEALAAALLARGVGVLGLARGGNAALAARFPGLLAEAELDLADAGALADWLDGGALAAFLAGAPQVLLINNAGMLAPVGPLASQAPRQIARAASLNIGAPLMLAAAVAGLADAGAERRIVHISSGAAHSAYPGWSVYGAGKAALDQHARAVAAEQAPGLRICSLAPGVIDTAMQAQIRASSPEQFPLRARFQALKDGGQLSSPADCAAALLAYALGEQFGQLPVADLRQLGMAS